MSVAGAVISVDTKKKELVGDFKNAGREWLPSGQPELVRVHDLTCVRVFVRNPGVYYAAGFGVGHGSVGVGWDGW